MLNSENIIEVSKNLFNPEDSTVGYVDQYGKVKPDTNYYYTKPFEVAAGDVFRNIGRNGLKVNFRFISVFDENGEIIRELSTANGTENVTDFVVTSDEAATVIFSVARIRKSGSDRNLDGCTKENLMIYKNSTEEEFKEYGTFLTNELKLNSTHLEQVSSLSPLENKKIVFFGTSITNGHALKRSYADLIGERTGADIINNSVSGAKLTDVLDQINAYDGEADAIIFEGGSNENTLPLNSINFGMLTDGFARQLDTTTIYGCMETILKTLQTKWIGVPIIFVATHKMATRDIKTTNKFFEVQMECADKWGCSVVDLYKRSTFNTFIAATKAKYTYNSLSDLENGNGTHPNLIGYETFYVPQVEAKLLEVLS